VIDWQPIESMPADEVVLLGWQGWPQIVREKAPPSRS
jgi:hypothetical protein